MPRRVHGTGPCGRAVVHADSHGVAHGVALAGRVPVGHADADRLRYTLAEQHAVADALALADAHGDGHAVNDGHAIGHGVAVGLSGGRGGRPRAGRDAASQRRLQRLSGARRVLQWLCVRLVAK